MLTEGVQLAPFFGLHCRMHFHVELDVSGKKISTQGKVRWSVEIANGSTVARPDK